MIDFGVHGGDLCTIAILLQRIVYGNKPPPTSLPEDGDLEQALALDEE